MSELRSLRSSNPQPAPAIPQPGETCVRSTPPVVLHIWLDIPVLSGLHTAASRDPRLGNPRAMTKRTAEVLQGRGAIDLSLPSRNEVGAAAQFGVMNFGSITCSH